jgi:Domain of unknown function (DUF3303)
MLFLARYVIELANVETAMAKRLEFEELKPENMRIVCEYTAHGVSEPLSGFLVFETDDVQVLNFLVMYYGRTVSLDIRPCSDVLTAIATTQRSLDRMSGGELDGAD